MRESAHTAPPSPSRRNAAQAPDTTPTAPSGKHLRVALAAREEFVEQVAERVVELLRDDAPLLDAAAVARRLGRSREWVYRHATELGAVQLGDGERPRLGFPPAAVADYVDACSTGRRTKRRADRAVKRNRRYRDAEASGQGADLLPIRGEVPPQ